MIKKILRELLILLPFKVTKNTYYDRLTRKIIQNQLVSTSTVIDVGCHKGEMMDVFRKYAPQGSHIGVEPIPALAAALKKKYQDTDIVIHEGALSDYKGTASFNLVTTNPAYSGLKKRSYDRAEKDTTIQISVTQLDHIVPEKMAVDLIKIDVEGGELGVLKGAKKVLKKWHPLLIFEHGKGGADHYNYGPVEIFNFLSTYGYQIYTLEAYLHEGEALEIARLQELYEVGEEYYFVAK